ncbi:hypothetical protein HN371_29570 [Candidatus Poribacteria bacterium]|jgi:hypothetical protein|nr:hypothetical protein [Candidatus Poribacteria bacterium]MBT5535169.1 hypothetical protein [Candidatus Poribacteria bacterium]MBT5711633.1 hypothetical protein [Candidatus Poribacteria bacterium]MBT7808396.1 hypothetical protein [Candidatus Poribacteria bacterium]
MNTRDVGVAFRVWNRKLHFYFGLYLLLFLWLFGFSGLLLNHGGWGFAQFWPQREVTATQQSVQIPGVGTDIALAEELAAQLGLSGEFDWTERLLQENALRFRVGQPGDMTTVTVDLGTAEASIENIRFNVWGMLRALHTFTGVRDGDPTARDWLPTLLWVVSMDAVAAGSIFLVLSGIYMWYQLRTKRRPGLAALGLGLGACSFFVFGLARLF